MATYLTLTEARLAYLENAGYAESGSAVYARRFITACRSLLVLQPVRSMAASHQIEFSPRLIREELESAQQWLATHGGGPGSPGRGAAKYFDMSGLRD